MKSEEQHNQMEELLLKLLNCSKAPVNDITMYSTIETFEYVPENDKTFDTFYRRYEDVFNVDCKEWSKEKKVRLLLRKLGTTEHNESTVFSCSSKKNKKKQWIWSSQTVKLLFELFGPNASLFHKRWKCLNIFKDDQRDYLMLLQRQ